MSLTHTPKTIHNFKNTVKLLTETIFLGYYINTNIDTRHNRLA